MLQAHRSGAWPRRSAYPASFRRAVHGVSFHAPPGRPGFYRVALQAEPGFASTRSGSVLPYGDWSRADATLHFNMWWPHDTYGDSSLARMRRRWVGKNMYGFGGIALGCQPKWLNIYNAATPVRVRAVVRDRGQVEELWTGTTVHWGNDAARRFFAMSPLRFIVERPIAKPLGFGGSTQRTSERCPAVVLADWQVSEMFSSVPPPKSISVQNIGTPLRIGMSRADVVWLNGFPNEFGDRVALLSQRVWAYDDGPGDAYHVTFRNGRVAAFTKPVGLP